MRYLLPLLIVIPCILLMPAALATASLALSVGAFLVAIGLATWSRPLAPALPDTQQIPVGEIRMIVD